MKIVLVINDRVFEGFTIESEHCPHCNRKLDVSEVEVVVVLVGRAAAYPYRLAECSECCEYYYVALPAEVNND